MAATGEDPFTPVEATVEKRLCGLGSHLTEEGSEVAGVSIKGGRLAGLVTTHVNLEDTVSGLQPPQQKLVFSQTPTLGLGSFLSHLFRYSLAE